MPRFNFTGLTPWLPRWTVSCASAVRCFIAPGIDLLHRRLDLSLMKLAKAKCMSISIVTGSAGLIGSESAKRFHAEGFDVIGIDNDMRARFFGPAASTAATRATLIATLSRYRHHDIDIRDTQAIEALFRSLGRSVDLIVHTAAQPSHDWAAREPETDFQVNALGTLNLLEATRKYCPD